MRLILLLLFIFGCSSNDSEISLRKVSTDPKTNKPPLLIISNGPGLSYKYLLEHISPLSKDRDLYFYNQHTCYTQDCYKQPLELKNLTEQLEHATNQLGNNYGILTDGWGAIILLDFLSSTPKDKHPKEVVLVNPPAFSADKQTKFSNSNNQQFTKEEAEFLQNLDTHHKCSRVMEISLKYNLKHPIKNKPLNIGKFDCMLNMYINSKMQNYDYSIYEFLLPEKTLFVFGQDSVITTNKKHVRVSRSSYYPFYENNKEFTDITSNFLKETKK